MLKSFTYEFVDELEYDCKGDKNIAESIEIKAPSNKLKLYTTCIECAYMNASQASFNALAASMSEEKIKAAVSMSNETAEETELTPIQIVNSILANSDSKKMAAVYDALDMILRDSAKIDGSTNFGSALFEKMSLYDTKCILGEYIKNFFTVSPQA
jgi:hypothetical protein